MAVASSTGERAQGRRASGDGRTALLVIDMLNDYRHEDGDTLAESAGAVVGNIQRMVAGAGEHGALVVHINDNHGVWSADRHTLVERAYACGDRSLIDPIVPADDAPFLFKARHSIFYGSSLEYLLDREGITELVLTGQVTEQCILYSALDAYIRHYRVVVPRDGVAHIDQTLADAALEMMRRNMQATILEASEVWNAR